MEDQIEDPIGSMPFDKAFTLRFETSEGHLRLRVTGVLRPLALSELNDLFAKMESRQSSVQEIRATRTGIGRIALGYEWISKDDPAIWGAKIVWDKGVLDHDVLLLSQQSADLA
jgi:hypothetical protein